MDADRRDHIEADRGPQSRLAEPAHRAPAGRRRSRSVNKAQYIEHAAGFVELEHYYRPPGLRRSQQPWLATVWRKA